MALGAVGMTEAELRLFPQLKLAADELTSECLTTPFDRELVSCVGRHRDHRVCFVEFQLRQQQVGHGESLPSASRANWLRR
jgi:hypothetical protein